MNKTTLLIISIFILILSCKKDDDTVIYSSNIPNDYIAKYSLDNNSLDDSENENHGDIIGNVWPTVNRYGFENSAMYFRTNQAYINVDNSQELNLLDSYTISVWVKSSLLEGNNWKTIISKWGWGDGYYLGINPDNLKLRYSLGTTKIELESPFEAYKWTHILITHDLTHLKIYLNGVINKEIIIENEMSGTHYPFRIGGQDGYIDGTSFNGAIDDILIYDRVLNSDEINELNIGNY